MVGYRTWGILNLKPLCRIQGNVPLHELNPKGLGHGGRLHKLDLMKDAE